MADELARLLDLAVPVPSANSLPALPAKWSWTTLGEVASFINGDRSANYPNQSDYTMNGVAFVNTGHIEPTGRLALERMQFISRASFDRLRAGKLLKGDIVYCLRGSTIGKIARVDLVEGAVASSLVIIRARPRILQSYLYCFLAGPFGQQLVRQHDNGSAQPNLSVMAISRYPVPLPPLDEQEVIAGVLGSLDDQIDLNRRMNATLEAMARALFQSWFVDFVPIRAKVDGRPPAGLEAATSALFPDAFQESSLGPIPHGWRAGSIYEIAAVIYGAPFASKLFNTNGHGKPLIRIRDLADETPGVWTSEVHPNGYTVRPGDIVVGMDGEFRAYLWGGAKAWLNQRVCVFAVKPGFSAAFVRNSIFEPLAQVEATETATTVIHIGKNDIDKFTVIIPDAAVVKAFAMLCQPWYDRIVANKRQSHTLAMLRDTLLPKLLSGELRVAHLNVKSPA